MTQDKSVVRPKKLLPPISVRLAVDEIEKVESAAKAAGMTRHAWLRQSIMAAVDLREGIE